VPLVRLGEVVNERGVSAISEMVLQISRDYAGLPDPRTLSLGEIKFFYSGLTNELIGATKDG